LFALSLLSNLPATFLEEYNSFAGKAQDLASRAESPSGRNGSFEGTRSLHATGMSGKKFTDPDSPGALCL
jgi:hypothetical protein